MRFEIRSLSRAISTLAVLCVFVFGASPDVSAHQRRGRDWGRGHNRGRHLGWERGRRVGQHRRVARRSLRRERRVERRTLRRHRRIERRSLWDGNRGRERSRFGRERAEFRAARFTRSRGGRGRH
ncbi:MAG: hypothetical protein ABR603_05000 [Pyrinomonadaceae bacterium]